MLTSVPSHSALKIPYTGQPNTQVQVYHSSSQKEVAPDVIWWPVWALKKSNSYAPQLECIKFESIDQSICVIYEECFIIFVIIQYPFTS